MPACREHRGEGLDVDDAAGEDEAVPPASQGGGRVLGDLGVAQLVVCEEPVHLGERARRVQIHVGDLERGLVDAQQPLRTGIQLQRG